MPEFTGEWRDLEVGNERQVAFDLPDANGVSGVCVITLDRVDVWRDALHDPAGVRIEVTLTPLAAEEQPPAEPAPPAADTPPAEATR